MAKSKITQWEYYIYLIPKERTDDTESILNALGADGWELIYISPEHPKGIRYYLKRPKI
jgi:hypothetical protein